jgi:hypothetical protein
MLPQNGAIDPNILLMNYASTIGGMPGYSPSNGHIPIPPNDDALLALNLFYVQSAMAQLAAQKEMLNSRLYAPTQSNLLGQTSEDISLPSSPASMSPARMESLSPQPEKMRSVPSNPYRRKRRESEEYVFNPIAKRTKNSSISNMGRAAHSGSSIIVPQPVSGTQPSPVIPTAVDLKQTFLDLYEVYGVIGVGGGGMVYAGRRITDKLPVAIKRVMREKVKRWEKVQGHSVPQEIALMLR